MKKLSIIPALLLLNMLNLLAQEQRLTNRTTEENRIVNSGIQKNAIPEGRYCDYCKQNYPEAHYPCIMKAIKGRTDAAGKITFVAGQPIGGIVVKGGKNPGGNLTLTTNDQGEIAFHHLSHGNYKFTVTTPIANPHSRATGTPIGGIIVKGGKNPGGLTSITLMTNKDGEVQLNNLSAGAYKFIIIGASQAEISNPLYESTHTEKENLIH